MPSLVTAIIKPFMLEEVKEALRGAGSLGLTVMQGYGRQGDKTEPTAARSTRPTSCPRCVSRSWSRPPTWTRSWTSAPRRPTGKIGDGKIWVYDRRDVMRIRTGECGDAI